MSTFTQKKWTVKGRHYGPSAQFRAETIEPNICEMTSSLPPETVRANAALIAAAPAMYEALTELLLCGENAGHNQDLLAQVKEALRLAEGRG